jgi:hypothetical protein
MSHIYIRSEIKDIPDSWDAELTIKLRNVISEQAFTELKGFILISNRPSHAICWWFRVIIGKYLKF